mgnify:FL=1
MSVTVTKVAYNALLTGLGIDHPNPPLVINIAAPSVAKNLQSTGGAMSNDYKVHPYVRIDVLPVELQQRIKMAVEGLSSF